MVVRPSPHGDFHYLVVTRRRTGKERMHEFASEAQLEPGDVLRLDGRYWLVASIEAGQDAPARAVAVPARYRLRLRHPDGREELGGLAPLPARSSPGSAIRSRLSKTGSPSLGRSSIKQLEQDEQGEPYLGFIAERDFAEVEALPSHSARAHARPQPGGTSFPPSAQAAFERAEQTGLSIKSSHSSPARSLIGRQPSASSRCSCSRRSRTTCSSFAGSTRTRIPRGTWLETVKSRLRSDLAQFRADVERDEDQIEQWSFRDGRMFASIGSPDDEADPLSGHGWMCRLVDAGVLTAAGFERVRKSELDPA